MVSRKVLVTTRLGEIRLVLQYFGSMLSCFGVVRKEAVKMGRALVPHLVLDMLA